MSKNKAENKSKIENLVWSQVQSQVQSQPSINGMDWSNSPTTVLSSRILYTPSPFARESLLYLQEIGELSALKPHTSSRDNLDSYLFLIVESGSGTIQYNGESHSVEAGDCVFLNCRFPYSHTSDQENLWTLRWIHFNGPTMLSIYQKYVERGGLAVFSPIYSATPLSPTEGTTDTSSHSASKYDTFLRNKISSETSLLSPFQARWTALMELAGSTDYLRDMKINQELTAILTLLMAESWHPESQTTVGKRTDLQEIRAYLQAHHTEKIALDDLSERFFINKYYLTRIFKETFGTSINVYLLDERITHAKQLLRFSTKSVEDIGLECGIGPLYYFSRVFKRVEGMSPSEYRRMW